MTKLTNEARSALQSARAKNRKATVILGNAAMEHGVQVPKHIVAKMLALEEFYAKTLAPVTAANVEASEQADDAPKAVGILGA